MKEISIRRARFEDAETIADFNDAMAYETEHRRFDRDVILAGVRGLFAHPHLGFYLVAEAKGEVVGSLMVTMEWSDWRNGIFWWVQSVYVRPEYRRRGIYRRLYRFVKALAAADARICGFRLYVERENNIAQKTYSAMGMAETPYLVFEEIVSEEKSREL